VRGADVFPGGIDENALPDLSHRAKSAHWAAAVVMATFVALGLTWVIFTDVVLYGVSRDPVLLAHVETAKGWTFIAVASVLIYAVTFRTAARLDRVRRLTAAVVDTIADGVLLLGHDQSIAYANPAAVRMLRCPLAELIGMSADEFSRRFQVSYPTGALVPPASMISQRVFEEGGPLRSKSTLHPPGGPEIVISANAAGVRKQVGEPAMWVVSVMHDITDSDRLEHMRDRFFAAAAHSLKTPVAVIKADEQALEPAAMPHQLKLMASIGRQCERIDRLVQNLLVLSRARTQTLSFHPSELELGPLVERIAQERAWSYRHDIHTEVTGSPAVRADGERLALVIRNLMYEAIRSSPARTQLTVMARPDGAGVAVGVRYQLLPPEDRANGAYGEYDDIGIGRSVAETIVAGHGGSLRDETSDTANTSWIHLPAGGGAHA